jgi:hypothetical protein
MILWIFSKKSKMRASFDASIAEFKGVGRIFRLKYDQMHRCRGINRNAKDCFFALFSKTWL